MLSGETWTTWLKSALCLLALTCSFASAHPGKVSYSTITVQGTELRQDIQLLTDELSEALPSAFAASEQLNLAILESKRDVLEQYLRDKVRVSTQGEWLQPKLDSIGLDLVEISDASPAPTLLISLNFKAPAPINDFLMQCRLLDEADERHNNFAKFNINGYVRPFMFTPSNTFRHGNPKDPAAAGQDSLWHTAASFGTHGIEHIFAGYDHLLFLIGLLLIATTLGTTVKIVTAFTIGHSISLALAALHVVAVPRGLLESLIALTIVYVGVENLFSWFPLKRWILSFSFGLVHGLAFAETLQLLELPLGQMLVALSSFNIGVEIAQVTVVLICLPFIFGLAKTSWRVQTIKALSLLIVLFGTGWFIDRALPGVLN